jgi:hypothetical protein
MPPVSLTLVANLPLVSTTLAELVANLPGVVDTGGKFEIEISTIPILIILNNNFSAFISTFC